MGLKVKRKLDFKTMSNYLKEVQTYLRDSMDRFGDLSLPSKRILTDYVVPIRMKQDENAYKVQVMVPGFDKKDLSVTVKDNVLQVLGERSKDESYEGNNEFFSEKCERKVALSDDIDYQNVKVDLKNGILNIYLPKKESKDKNEITFKIED